MWVSWSLEGQTGWPGEVAAGHVTAPGFPHQLSLLFPFSFPFLYPAFHHASLPIHFCQLCQSPQLCCEPARFISAAEDSQLFYSSCIFSWLNGDNCPQSAEEDRWLERTKGDVKDFPLLLKVNTSGCFSWHLPFSRHGVHSAEHWIMQLLLSSCSLEQRPLC